MHLQILKNPISVLEAHIGKGERVTAEAGTFMKGNMEIKTRIRGGLLKAVKVLLLGNESFFVNDHITSEDGCILGLTGPSVGDNIEIPIDENNGFMGQSGSHIASTRVNNDTKWQGFTRGVFGSDLFMLKATGNGKVFCNAYGSTIGKKLVSGKNDP